MERKRRDSAAAVIDDCNSVDLCGKYDPLDRGGNLLRSFAVLYPREFEGESELMIGDRIFELELTGHGRTGILLSQDR